MGELDWFRKMYAPDPKVFIAYDRTAFFGKDNPDFRITFDRRIRWRKTQLDPSKGTWGNLIIPESCVLMEIKTADSIPLELVHTLSDINVYPTSFSKYGTCYEQNLLPQYFSAQRKGMIYYA